MSPPVGMLAIIAGASAATDNYAGAILCAVFALFFIIADRRSS